MEEVVEQGKREEEGRMWALARRPFLSLASPLPPSDFVPRPRVKGFFSSGSRGDAETSRTPASRSVRAKAKARRVPQGPHRLPTA